MNLNAVYISNIDPAPAPTTSYRDLGCCLRCGSPAHWIKDFAIGQTNIWTLAVEVSMKDNLTALYFHRWSSKRVFFLGRGPHWDLLA
jgi:hypothetical protein